MATEADISQFIHATKKEGEGQELSSEPLTLQFNELPQEEMQKAEHRHNTPLEAFNMGEAESMQVPTNINVDTANAFTHGVGTVEGEVFIAGSSVPKVACKEISSVHTECETVEQEKDRIVTEEISEEDQTKTSYQDGEDEKSGVSIISLGKEMDAEVTKQREETEEEKNDSADIVDDEEEKEKEEGAKENLGGPLVAAQIEETSEEKAEQDEEGNLKDNSSAPFDKRSTQTTERPKHEEQFEQSFLTKTEPEKEKLERSLDIASEKVPAETTAAFEERRPIESFEEILKEEKKEATYHTADMERESLEEKNLSRDSLSEKFEKVEDRNTEESASGSYVTHPPVYKAVHLVGEKQDQDSKAEPEHGDELMNTCANQGIGEQVQDEENKIEAQALASIKEEKTAGSSKKDEEIEEAPKQELDEIFASTAGEETKKETSFGENEENGPNDEVPQANEEGKETTTPTKKETGNDKECKESIEEEVIQETPKEVETREDNKSAQPNVEAENQSIDEIDNVSHHSSTVADRNTEENFNEKEMGVMESEEEGKNSDTTCPPEKTKAETLKAGADNDTQCTTGASREIPYEETTKNLVQSSSAPQVYEEQTGEEILHKTDTPVTWVTEETSLKEVNPEDKMQSESSDECESDGVNVVDKHVEATDLGENENIQIQTAENDGAAEVGEEIVFETQSENKNPSPKLNDEREVSTDEMLQDHISEEKEVKESFAPSSCEQTPLTTEASEISEENAEKFKGSYGSKHSPLTGETNDENILQAQEKFVDPEVHACMASSDLEMASPNEEVHDDGQQLQLTPAPNTWTDITESEGVEVLESIKTSETSYVSKHSPLAAETTEEKIMQVQEKFMDPEVHAYMASSDMEKDGPTEEEVHDGGQKLHVTPAPNTETTMIESEGELQESIKTTEDYNSSHIGELESSKDEKSQNTYLEDNLEAENPINDTSIEECNEGTDTKEAILGQEYSSRNFKGGSDEDIEIEKSVVGVETEGHSHKAGVSESKSTNESPEEVPVTTEESQDIVTPVLEESEIDKDYTARSIEQQTVQESSQEVQARVDSDSAQANIETENQSSEESDNANLPSSTSVEKTIEESFKFEERDVLESTAEIKNSGMETMEQNFDTKWSSEDTKDETSTVLPKETNEDIGERSTVPHVYEEHRGEEILHKAETTIADENEVPKGQKLQEYKSEENLKEPHTLTSRELNLATSEATDTAEEIQEEAASYVDTHSPLAAETTEEKQLQIEDESTDTEVRTYMATTAIEKDNENEEDQQLHVNPALVKETSIAESADVELPVSIKAGEVADCNIGKTEISKDEKLLNNESEKDKVEDQRPVNDGSNEACDTSPEIEKAIIEEEHSDRNFKNSLNEDVIIEKEVGEVEAECHIQETEVPERKSTSTVNEEVPETTKDGLDMVIPDIQQIDGAKDWTTESIEEKTVQESFPENEEIEVTKSAPASIDTEDENTEGNDEACSCSPTVVERSIEESLEEEEKDVTESKQEVKNSDRELLEQNFDTRCPTDDTNAETLKDEAKSNQDCNTQSTTDTSKVPPAKETNEDLVENTPVPCVSEKDAEEEILHKSETRVTGVTEEAVLMELNEEDKILSDSFNLVPDSNLTTAESFEKRSDGADTEHAEASKFDENKNMEILTPKISDVREVSPGEKLHDFISEQNPKEPHATSSSERDLLTTQASETTDYTPGEAGASYVSPHSPFDEETIEETTLQIHDMPMNPEVQAYMEREGPNEEVHDEDQQPHMIPALNTEGSITEPGNAELLKISETSEVVERSNIGQVENSKDEKWLNAESEDKLENPVNETSNEACNTSTATEKASQEQEHSSRNVESNLKENVEIEKEAFELEAGDHEQEIGVSETNCTSTVTEENPESIKTQAQPRSESESITGDQSDKTIPLLDGIDVIAKLPEDVSVLGENKNMEIPTAAKEEEAESEEKADHEVQKETCDTSSKCEDEREVSAADTPPVYTAEQNLEDSSILSSGEHSHVTTKASETADEPQEIVEASSVNTYAHSAEDIIEDKLFQKQVEHMYPRDEIHLAAIDTEISSSNEEVHGEDQEMYKTREHTEQNVTESQEVELQKSTETSEVISDSDIAKWDILPVQKSLNDEVDEEAEKTIGAFNEACNTSLETEKAILEQIKDSDPVPTENPAVTNHGENKVTAEFKAAGSDTENQINITCSQTNTTNIEDNEECSKSFKDLDLESVGQQVIGDDFQEGQREIYEETEPKFKATNQSKETWVVIETITNVMLNEEVSEAVEKDDESEDINGQTVEGENCRTETGMTVVSNEIANKITYPDQRPIGNLVVTGFSETAETLNLQDAEDLSGDTEEDMKKDREKPDSITCSELGLSAQNIKETDIAPTALNRELVELDPNEQVKCTTELEAEDQSIETLHETKIEEDINNIKNMTLESTGEKIMEQDIQESGTGMPGKVESTLEPKNQSEQTQTTIERIKDVILTEEVQEATEKTKESENIEEEITKEESCIQEHQMKLTSNKMKTDPAPMPTDNLDASVSCENPETVKRLAAEDLDLESESSITKAPEEDKKKAPEESTNITSSVSAISKETFEEENAEAANVCNDKMHIAPVTEDETSEEVQQEEKSTRDFDTTSDDKTQEVKTTSPGLQGEEVDSEKLEDNSGALSPPTVEGEVVDNESENLENKYGVGVEVEEPITSDAISNSNEKDVENIHESHKNSTVDSTFEDKFEDENNKVLKTISEPNHQGVDTVSAGEVLHQTLSSGNITEQVQQQLRAMPSKEESCETTSKSGKIEEDDGKKVENLVNEISESSFAMSTEEETCLTNTNTKEVEVSNLKLELTEDPMTDSPDEAPKEECTSLGEAKSVQPHENVSKVNFVDSPSESEKSLGIEKTMDSSSKEASKEDTSPSHCSTVKEISTILEVDEKCEEPSPLDLQKNEKAFESMYGEEPAESAETQTKEEQIITATTGTKAEENQSGITNEASETIMNEIKSEMATKKELAKDTPVELPDKEPVRSNYEEDVQVAVGYPGEKKIEELVANTDAIHNEKVNDSEFVWVKHNEGKESAMNKEPVTTHDAVDALAEEAPPKVGQEVEEISEGIQETIQAYDVKKDEEEEHIGSTESLKDDVKPEHINLESTFDACDITDGLNLKEQGISVNETRTSVPTGDKLNETRVNEELSDIISDKQITAEMIIPEEVKCIKYEPEHTNNEEKVDAKRERNVEFNEAKIQGTVHVDGEVETQDQSEKIDVSSHKKDSSVEITQRNSTMDLVPDKDVLVETYPNESKEPRISTGSKDVPEVQPELNTQTFHESKDLKSENASGAEPEAKGGECLEEIITGEECKEATEEYSSTESAKNLLSDLLNRSTKESKQLQADKAETADVEEAKADEEEEGDEHKTVDSGSDAPVMVEACDDVNQKVAAHKKSHNIFSGVGSKVKHSITKVKKAITGKSSHPKPSSPK